MIVMLPDLSKSQSIDFAGRPAHMSAIDWVLWQRFRRQRILTFDRIYYDVLVGRGAVPVGDVDPKVVAAWARLTRLRVDVLGESIDHWTIIELRGAAGPGAVGSLLTYAELWKEDSPDGRDLQLWLITDSFPENLLSVLKRFSITLFVV